MSNRFIHLNRDHLSVHIRNSDKSVSAFRYTAMYKYKQQGYKVKQKVRKQQNQLPGKQFGSFNYVYFDLNLKARFTYLFMFFMGDTQRVFFMGDTQRGKSSQKFTNSHIKCEIIIIRGSHRTPVITFIFIAQME